MSNRKKLVAPINFNHGWFRYFQSALDQSEIESLLDGSNKIRSERFGSLVDLPDELKENELEQTDFKCWYSKSFQWIEPIDGKIQLVLKSSSINQKQNLFRTIIRLNGHSIFDDSIRSDEQTIDLTEHLSGKTSENELLLTICCFESPLNFDVFLLIDEEILCATGQVQIGESSTNSDRSSHEFLDYTVSMNDDDGRFFLNFNPKRRSSRNSIFQLANSTPIIERTDSSSPWENFDEEMLVPRLAIVILIVGTRGDVQPFIALGKELQRSGHRVRLATHEVFRSFVTSNDLEFFPLAGDPADLMSFMVKNAGIIPSMRSIVEGDVSKKRQMLADILTSTWQACHAPDDQTGAPFTAQAIIANPPSFGHIHCAEKLKIPLHIMFTMPWSPTAAFPHPLSNIDRSIGPRDKINIFSYDVIEMLTWTGMRDIINNFRKKTLHLSSMRTRHALRVLIEERTPHTYCWSPSLVAKPNDWKEHINVSGFFFLDLATSYQNPPKDLTEFLGIDDNESKHRSLPPPIYIGFGSITGHDSQRILSVVVEALTRTGYRAVLSGLASDSDQLPSNIFKIGNVPHDWLFQHVSAVCHHGGAGTTAAGLRAGKPTIIVPFFGDQFFWGTVIEKSGAGPKPLPGKSITVDGLVEALHFAHQPSTRAAAEQIRDGIASEDGCAAAVHAFHANLPLRRMHSDLEPTFGASYYLKNYDLQISRQVALVLVGAGCIEESELINHQTRDWNFMSENVTKFPTYGIINHSQKAFSSLFLGTADDLKQAMNNPDVANRALESAGSLAKGVGLGVGHLSLGCLSLYGEVTDTLDLVTSACDPFQKTTSRARPHVKDFKSGAKAAGEALWYGWKDGITGIVIQPRIGYQKHGPLGGAAGTIMGTLNMVVKPSVGTLSSVTWITRGTYASVKKAVESYQKEGRRISSNLLNSATNRSDSVPLNEDDETIYSDKIREVSNLSGFHPKVCQDIVDEFEKMKIEKPERKSTDGKKTVLSNLVSSSKETIQNWLPGKNKKQ